MTEKSITEIKRTLDRYGASQFAWAEDSQRGLASVQFALAGQGRVRPVQERPPKTGAYPESLGAGLPPAMAGLGPGRQGQTGSGRIGIEHLGRRIPCVDSLARQYDRRPIDASADRAGLFDRRYAARHCGAVADGSRGG